MTGRRVLYYGELLRMTYAEQIVAIYQSRKASSNWVEWSASYPEEAAALAEAERLYNA